MTATSVLLRFEAWIGLGRFSDKGSEIQLDSGNGITSIGLPCLYWKLG